MLDQSGAAQNMVEAVLPLATLLPPHWAHEQTGDGLKPFVGDRDCNLAHDSSLQSESYFASKGRIHVQLGTGQHKK